MADIKIKVQHNNLGALDRALDGLLTRTVTNALALGSHVYATRVPVRTGALKASRRVTQRGTTGELSTSMHYAAHVEFGTRYQRSKPYMRPAAQAMAQRLRDARGEIATEIGRLAR